MEVKIGTDTALRMVIRGYCPGCYCPGTNIIFIISPLELRGEPEDRADYYFSYHHIFRRQKENKNFGKDRILFL